MCYLARSCDISSLWSSHMLCRFECNLTEWAKSIFPSCERTNPALNTFASIYPIGIIDRHLFSYLVIEWRLMQSKNPPVIVIRYVLTVKELGYNSPYYRNVNMMTQSCCNNNIGYLHHGIHQWYDPIVNWHKCWKTRSSIDQWASIKGLLGTLVSSIPHIYQYFQLTQLYHSIKLITKLIIYTNKSFIIFL
jgi:hypothetical protein